MPVCSPDAGCPPRFCPAVQMKIDFLYAEIMNFADLLFAHGKRHYAVIFLRILRIEKAGLRLHNRLDSRMNKKHVPTRS